MSVMFDLRTLRDTIAYSAKQVFRDDRVALKTRECANRPLLVLRWWRGKDGHLESRWERSK